MYGNMSGNVFYVYTTQKKLILLASYQCQCAKAACTGKHDFNLSNRYFPCKFGSVPSCCHHFSLMVITIVKPSKYFTVIHCLCLYLYNVLFLKLYFVYMDMQVMLMCQFQLTVCKVYLLPLPGCATMDLSINVGIYYILYVRSIGGTVWKIFLANFSNTPFHFFF